MSDTSTEQLVRDAMLPDPHPLDGGMSAQEAAEALTRPAVRAVLVCDDGRLVGVITRKTLVREVVAAGRDPRTTTLREIAEPPNATIDSGMPLAQAFAFLEEQDFERVPVVENGKLVGVLSRSAVQRRLAEDDPPEAPLVGADHQDVAALPPRPSAPPTRNAGFVVDASGGDETGGLELGE